MSKNEYKIDNKSSIDFIQLPQEEINALVSNQETHKVKIDVLESKLDSSYRTSQYLQDTVELLVNKIYGTNEEEGLKVKIEKIEQKTDSINENKINFVTWGGIFVSVFTFISVEIQILKYVCDFWRIAGFSLIIFSVLSSFVLLIQFIGGRWQDIEYKLSKNIYGLLVVLPFCIGIILPLMNHFEVTKDTCILYQENINSLEYRIQELEFINRLSTDNNILPININIKSNSAETVVEEGKSEGEIK